MFISKELLGILGICLVLLAYIPYIHDILRKKVKPHPFSWFVWTITAAAIFMIQTSNGSGPGAYTTATIAIMAFIVFILSYRLNKSAIRKLDIVCLIIACIGIVLWLSIDEPLISLLFLLGVEVIGFIPTLRKALEKPYEDSISLWSISGLRHAIGFSAIAHYNAVTVLNPLVWIVMCTTLCTVLLVRRSQTKKPRNRVRKFRPHN